MAQKIYPQCKKEFLKDLNLENLNISLYRIEEDLYCNIPGAMNLSAKECDSEWILFLDMDTLISKKMSEQLLEIVKIKQKNLNYYYKNKELLKQKFEMLSEKEKLEIYNKRKTYQRNYWLKSRKIIILKENQKPENNNTIKPYFDGFVRF